MVTCYVDIVEKKYALVIQIFQHGLYWIHGNILTSYSNIDYHERKLGECVKQNFAPPPPVIFQDKNSLMIWIIQLSFQQA